MEQRIHDGWRTAAAIGAAALLMLSLPGSGAGAQQPVDSARANAIAAPATPLASEAASAGVTKFSFIVYGDTRGSRDGIDIHPVHSLVVESMLRKIADLRSGPDPVRFVLQSGDAVVNGAFAAQWNVSFNPIVDQLAIVGGVPYFLSAGNHDVSSADTVGAPSRVRGLRNYYSAMANLIPPNGSPRRLNDYPAYAFGYGNTFVLAFDSNIAGDTIQFAWVKSQLEGLDRRRYQHISVFIHHPAYSSGPHGGAVVERSAAIIRERYMPLFRKHNVDMLFAGHEHLFEHWVEHWVDSTGKWRRMDQIVTGGGGAPIYTYQGEPDLREYRLAGRADSLRVVHYVRPGVETGENPPHYVVVHVDGERMWQEVIGVDWGRNYAPYRSNRAELVDTSRTP